MKSKVFQKIAAWIQERLDARQDRRHRRALIRAYNPETKYIRVNGAKFIKQHTR